MKLISRLTRLTPRALLGLSLLYNVPFAVLQIQRNAYDTYVHIFLADHYRRAWFDLWEPRWYLGFSVASYPPLVHQLIALLSAPLELLMRWFSPGPEAYAGAWRWAGEEAAYVVVQVGVLALFPLAARAFARIWVGPRAATVAAVLMIVLPGLSLVIWSFGQLPSVTATAIVLMAMGRGYDFLRGGRGRHLAQAVSLAALAGATHHGVFLLVPFAGVAVVAQALIHDRPGFAKPAAQRENRPETGQSRRGQVGRTLGRLAAWGGLSALAVAAVLWPMLAWSRGQAMQVPIDHLSRHDYLRDVRAVLFFFLPMYGPLLVALPWAALGIPDPRVQSKAPYGRDRGAALTAARPRCGRLLALAALALMLMVLGLGGTTPLPRILFGAGWAWLTYERFAFWAAVALAILAGAGVMLLARRRPRAAAAFPGMMLIAAVLAGGLTSYSRAQPPGVNPGPLVEFLNLPANRPYRYFTLGFGDQLAKLSAVTSNGTPDGTYHTARQLPELRLSGIGAIDTVMWSSDAWEAGPFLARAEDYGARWAFVHHAFYEAVLKATGWVYRYDVGQVQLWEKPGVRPVRVAPSPGLNGTPAAVWWGLVPLGVLALTGAALAADRPWRLWRALWTRKRLAEAAGSLRGWSWAATIGLMSLWWFHALYQGDTPWVYFVYQSAMLFLADAAAAATLALWLTERALRGGTIRAGPRGVGLALLAVIVVVALSMVRSVAPAVTAALAAQLVLLAAWYVMLINDPPSARLASAVIVGVCAGQALLAVAQAATQTTAWLHPLNLPWPGSVQAAISGVSVVAQADGGRWLRAYGTLSHPNILGGYLLVGLALAGERFWATRGRGWLAVGGLIALGILLTFSRSAWLATGVMAGVLFGLWLRRWPKRRLNWAQLRRWAAVGLGGLALLMVPMLPLVAARVQIGGDEAGLEQRSLSDRVRLNRAAVEMFLRVPWTGVGGGGFVVGLYAAEGVALPLEPAHNLLLLLAAELGLPGAAAAAGLLGATAWWMWRRGRQAEPAELVLASVVAGMLVIGLFDHYWWTMPPARMWFVTVLGLWAGYSARKPFSLR